MRTVIVSHLYLDPGQRGKLHALAGLDCAIVAAVPGGLAGTDGRVRIAPVPASGDSDAPESLRWSSRAFRKLFSDFRPDLVQIEEEPYTQAAASATAQARRLGIPTVLFSWESLPRSVSLLERIRSGKVFRGAGGVIGGNTMATALLHAAAPDLPAITLPQSGIAAPVSPDRPARAERSLAIGFVGRLVPERGVDQLLRACAMVMGSWTLQVVGTGPEQEALEALSQRLGLASRVFWLGALGRSDTDRLWPELDCLVVPSRTTDTWVERFSPVLVQAMAHGVTPVVTHEGVLPETVANAGLVVRDTEEMGVALQTLLADPDHCRALGREARRRILAEYPDPVIAERTVAFWREVKRWRSGNSATKQDTVATGPAGGPTD